MSHADESDRPHAALIAALGRNRGELDAALLERVLARLDGEARPTANARRPRTQPAAPPRRARLANP